MKPFREIVYFKPEHRELVNGIKKLARVQNATRDEKDESITWSTKAREYIIKGYKGEIKNES